MKKKTKKQHDLQMKPNNDTNSIINLPAETVEMLPQIGSIIASLWGGECYDSEVCTTENKVIFHCIEHGEKFVTEVAFARLDKYISELNEKK